VVVPLSVEQHSSPVSSIVTNCNDIPAAGVSINGKSLKPNPGEGFGGFQMHATCATAARRAITTKSQTYLLDHGWL
jgi:hypothetical protein